MVQAANTDFFNPLVAKAHNSEFQNLLFPLQSELVKVSYSSLRIFIFCTHNTKRLILNVLCA